MAGFDGTGGAVDGSIASLTFLGRPLGRRGLAASRRGCAAEQGSRLTASPVNIHFGGGAPATATLKSG